MFKDDDQISGPYRAKPVGNDNRCPSLAGLVEGGLDFAFASVVEG
jgi:hypothetical protein